MGVPSVHAIRVLAKLAAKKAVEAEIKAQGRRVHSVPNREIREQADLFLDQHPELYDEAKHRARLMGLFEKQPKRPRPKITAT